jgi:hypothetical protein
MEETAVSIQIGILLAGLKQCSPDSRLPDNAQQRASPNWIMKRNRNGYVVAPIRFCMIR